MWEEHLAVIGQFLTLTASSTAATAIVDDAADVRLSAALSAPSFFFFFPYNTCCKDKKHEERNVESN